MLEHLSDSEASSRLERFADTGTVPSQAPSVLSRMLRGRFGRGRVVPLRNYGF